MTGPLFKGVITALITPLRDGIVDEAAFERLLERQIAGGVHGVVPMGTTGESATLHPDEHKAVVEMCVRIAAGRVRVIAGAGSSATDKAIDFVRHAKTVGADGALVVTPPYVRPTQSGLVAHYRALADAGELPIVLYNVPGRTGCDLLPATVAELAAHPRIVGIKEARTDPGRMQDLLALRAPGFAVLSGDDPTALRALRAGADGVISVVANVCPRAFRTMCSAVAAGDLARAERTDAALASINDLLGAEPNPIPVKWLLHRMGLIGRHLRLPLLPLDASLHGRAERAVAEIARLEEPSRQGSRDALLQSAPSVG